MRVQNNSGATLEIGGVKIKSKEAESVPAWESIKGLPIIRAWLRCRILEVVGEAPQQPAEEPAAQANPEQAGEESEEPTTEDPKPKAFLGLKW